MSFNRTILSESFCPGIERLLGSHSVLGWNDSREVLLSRYGTPPGESFCPGMEQLQRSHSVLEYNATSGSFCPRIERLQGSPSVLG